MKISLADINKRYPRVIPTLSSLTSKAKQATTPMAAKVPSTQGTTTNDATSWSTVARKKLAPPKPATVATTIIPKPAHRYPIAITIGPKKQANGVVSHEQLRIMIGILIACQMVDPTAFIGPIKDPDPTVGAITTTDALPKDLLTISKYFENIDVDEKGYFSGRLYIHCNIEFYQFKLHPKFLPWLRKEATTFEIDSLHDIVLKTVGFQILVCIRSDLTEVYKERAKEV